MKMGGNNINIMRNLIIATLLIITEEAAAEGVNSYVYGLCNTQDYTAGSDFSLNLNKAIGTLAAKASTTLYASVTIADPSSSNTSYVYAMYQCRGDVSLDQCGSCVRQVEGNNICGSAIGMRVQYGGCYFRYENYDFLGVPDVTLVDLNCSADSAAGTDPTYRANLQSALSAAAASAPSHALFGYNATSVSDAYALTQCVGYVSGDECRKCLSQVSDVSSFCPNSTSGYAYYVTCSFLFNNQTFLFS